MPTNRNNQLPDEPAPPTIMQSFATNLWKNEDKNETPINIFPPKITTKQGHPPIIFKKERFYGKLADRCRFTLIRKFSNTMPRMKVIRRSFIFQTQLTGGVKIAHFNSRHSYIDLNNEADHITVWTKQKMYINSQLMRCQLWTSTFNSEEETFIVPVWATLPKLPCHCFIWKSSQPFFHMWVRFCIWIVPLRLEVVLLK